MDSHRIKRLPESDLVYVDGDHSFEGCLSDLRLAVKSTDTILVDDYDSIESVRGACLAFLEKQPEFSSQHIENGLTGFLLMTRNST